MQIMRKDFIPSDSLNSVVQAFRQCLLSDIDTLYLVLHNNKQGFDLHYAFNYDKEFHNDSDCRTLLELSLSIWKLRGCIKEFRLTLTDNDPFNPSLRHFHFYDPAFYNATDLARFIKLHNIKTFK